MNVVAELDKVNDLVPVGVFYGIHEGRHIGVRTAEAVGDVMVGAVVSSAVATGAVTDLSMFLSLDVVPHNRRNNSASTTGTTFRAFLLPVPAFLLAASFSCSFARCSFSLVIFLFSFFLFRDNGSNLIASLSFSRVTI